MSVAIHPGQTAFTGIPLPRSSAASTRVSAFKAAFADCLDRILIVGRRHLEHVLRVYRRHYNEHRPHRALELLPPNGGDSAPLNAPDRLQRRDLLGGLIHEYEAA